MPETYCQLINLHTDYPYSMSLAVGRFGNQSVDSPELMWIALLNGSTVIGSMEVGIPGVDYTVSGSGNNYTITLKEPITVPDMYGSIVTQGDGLAVVGNEVQIQKVAA